MMTPHTKRPPPSYDPSTERRDDERYADAAKGLWFRRLTFTEGLAAITIGASALSAFGWQRVTVNDLASRIAVESKRVDALEETMRFTTYLQCVQLKSTDPIMVPPTCGPIIERGARP